MSVPVDLGHLREQIDSIDQQLHKLLNQRAGLAQEVARSKLAAGECMDFYRPGREAEVLRMVQARNPGPLADDTVVRLFREIMSACLALEAPVSAAYLGPEGTFTHQAVVKHFGHAVHAVPLAAIDEIFREVESEAVSYGVVPIENSTEGVVSHTVDLFVSSPLTICGEVVIKVHHQLASKAESLADVKTIYSHSQSLAQCREWLSANAPDIHLEACPSNAFAAQKAQNDSSIAAITSKAACELYELPVLANNIEDNPNNTTRFLVIGRQTVPSTGSDKTALLVTTRNQPGALHKLLEPLARHGVSMTRIESRPSRRANWDYNFFLDVVGHQDDEPVAKALADLSSEANFVKVLGSWPVPVI